MSEIYQGAYYADRGAATRHAAKRILSLFREAHAFESVADVGCGVGTWRSVALDLGASRAFGWEGAWVTPDMLGDDRIVFETAELERALPQSPAVDLAISLEVAEHLSEARARSFVADLCAIAPVTLFGAAIPSQPGRGHVNLQWQSWWAGLFAEHGRLPLDLVRPAIWDDDDIPYWYRPNPLLYVSPEAPALHARAEAAAGLHVLDAVHRAFPANRVERARAKAADPGVKGCIRLTAGIPRAILRRTV